MGAWYTIGLFAGIGVGLGVVLAGVFGAVRGAAVLAAVLGAVAGALVGLGLADTEEAIAGAVGGLLGGFGASLIVTAALGRGGTRGATAFLVAFAGIGLAVLALVPIVGYLEAVTLPVLGVRLRRRADGRYQGLRILARD